MRTLLDTCILSKLRRSNCNENVRSTVAEMSSEEMFVSVISIGEIVKGIELLEASIRKKELMS